MELQGVAEVMRRRAAASKEVEQQIMREWQEAKSETRKAEAKAAAAEAEKAQAEAARRQAEARAHEAVEMADAKLREAEETKVASLESTEFACVVCLDAPREILLQPCKHFCLCSACAKSFVAGESVCPVCRSGVAASMRVFA